MVLKSLAGSALFLFILCRDLGVFVKAAICGQHLVAQCPAAAISYISLDSVLPAAIPLLPIQDRHAAFPSCFGVALTAPYSSICSPPIHHTIGRIPMGEAEGAKKYRHTGARRRSPSATEGAACAPSRARTAPTALARSFARQTWRLSCRSRYLISIPVL